MKIPQKTTGNSRKIYDFVFLLRTSQLTLLSTNSANPDTSPRNLARAGGMSAMMFLQTLSCFTTSTSTSSEYPGPQPPSTTAQLEERLCTIVASLEAAVNTSPEVRVQQDERRRNYIFLAQQSPQHCVFWSLTDLEEEAVTDFNWCSNCTRLTGWQKLNQTNPLLSWKMQRKCVLLLYFIILIYFQIQQYICCC